MTIARDGAPVRVHPGALPIRAYPTRGRRSAVVGLGAHLPERVVTNAELERVVDTSDAWIVERTGIRERRFAPPGTAAWQLATLAASDALREAGVAPESVDLVMVASSSPDAPFPAMAARVQERVGAANAWAFDVLAACTGLLYELAIADSMIACGRAENVLVIGAEVLSRILDWNDRSTCVLLGDGAGAALVTPARDGGGFRSWCLGSDGREWDLLTYGARAATGAYAAGDHDARFRMQGRETFRYAVECFSRMAEEVVRAADMSMGDIDLFVPHQANRRIIEASARRAGIPPERVMIDIERYGNTSTATIPLALRDAVAEGRLRRGQRALLASFGAGLSWAACVLEWEGAAEAS